MPLNTKLTAEALLEVVLTAAGAKTDEEKARAAWRFNDAMWRVFPNIPLGLARDFNNLLQDKNWPWVDLYTPEEIEARRAELNALHTKINPLHSV